MVVCSDPEYKKTKLVKLGIEKINPAFMELAEWITTSYGTKVLNIYYDKITSDKNRPRLSIIFEFFEEAERFKDRIGNFDETKQKVIADKFRQLQEKQNKKQNISGRLFNGTGFATDRLYVIFTAFEPIAREEITKIVPEGKIEELQNVLAMQDLWKIYRQFSLTTFFFYTDAQLKRYSSDGTTEFLKQQYYNLLKHYDEFNYIKPDTYFIKFDTKENFDNHYQSSWFYYSR